MKRSTAYFVSLRTVTVVIFNISLNETTAVQSVELYVGNGCILCFMSKCLL